MVGSGAMLLILFAAVVCGGEVGLLLGDSYVTPTSLPNWKNCFASQFLLHVSCWVY
jgi:hypothetical protein